MAFKSKRANLAVMFSDIGYVPPDNELATNTHYPQLNSKDYMTRMKSPADNTEPQEFHESMDINAAGNTIIATNDYRARFWVGDFGVYKTLQEYQQHDKMHPQNHKPATNSPINVVRFVQERLIALGRLSGTVEIWTTNACIEGYFPVDQKNEHIGSVLDVDVFTNNRNVIVTVDSEACIKIWEVNYLDAVSINTFRNAHADAITGVSTRPESQDVFATVSRDMRAHFWDLRLGSRPASGLLHRDVPLTAISWPTDDESYLVKIGDAAGSLITVDTRKAKQVLREISLFKRPVKRIRSSKGRVGVCGHTNVFKVLDNDDKIILEDDSSQDFVRDLVFHGGKVVGLCWDGNVVEKDV